MKTVTTKTSRGFGRVDFNDMYGQECSVQMSSSVKPAVWVGVDWALDTRFIVGGRGDFRVIARRGSALLG